MEDISRDLEKEIAHSKPKPYRQEHKTKLFLIDNFGEMKSGEYFKTFLGFLSIVSIISLSLAIVFYCLYSNLYEKNSLNNIKLDNAQKKVQELTVQKETLMAKLVISGIKIDDLQKPAAAKKTRE